MSSRDLHFPRRCAQAAARGARGLVLLVAGVSALAGQASGDVVVRVDFAPAPLTWRVPERVFCTTGSGPRTFGAIVTTVCSTGAVIELGAPERMGLALVHGGARRNLVELGEGLPALGWLVTPAVAGTVTGWQLQRHGQSNYLELTLGW